MDRLTVIQGTPGKAYGCVCGYIAGLAHLVDAVRSIAPTSFTTSLAPAIIGGALDAVRHLKASGAERARHQEWPALLKRRLREAGLPPSPSHIVKVLVGDSVPCNQASDMLLDEFAIYIQPMNYWPWRATPSGCASRPRPCTTIRQWIISSTRCARSGPASAFSARREPARPLEI